MSRLFFISALFIAAVLVVVLSSSAPGVDASLSHIRSRFRHGALFKELLQREKEFHARPGVGGAPNTTANWFDQLVDPLDASKGTFKQRWYIKYPSVVKSDIVLGYMNGEGPCTGSVTGYFAQFAEENGMITVAPENRGYGRSCAPTNNCTETFLYNASWLSTINLDSVLSDYNRFTEYIEKSVLRRRARWLIVGGSWSGATAAWAMQEPGKPSNYVASYSGSGVVHPIFAYTEYDGHVSSMLSSNCYDAVKHAYDDFERYYDDETTREHMYELLNVPRYFTKRDMQFALADNFAGLVQYGQRAAGCDHLLPESDTPLEKYVAVMMHFFGEGCFSNCGYSTECMSNPRHAWQWEGADRSWFYQCCSQVAWWQVGYGHYSLRSRNVSTEYMIDMCRKAFKNDTMVSDPFSVVDQRGGRKMYNTKYVVATQSSDDPWSRSGVLVSPRSDGLYPADVAQCGARGCGHCACMMSPTDLDPPAVVKQRQFVNDTLRKWLGL